MKLKKMLLGALAALSIVTLVACSSSSSSTNELESIKKAGKLVVAVSPDYAPFEFKALVDGKDTVVGADIQLAQAIADKIGVELEVSTMSFNNVLSSVKSGKADLAISGLSVTEERKKAFTFSDSYYETENAILVRADQVSNYTSLDNFSGKKVAVLKGTIEETLSKDQLSDSNIVSLTTTGEAINELKSGTVDAVDLEKPVAEGYLSQNSDLALASVALTVSDGDAKAVAMPKTGSDELADVVNEVIKDLKDNGTYKQYISDAAAQTSSQVE
ncbi:transporter substrate-binding domain-containing protein [Streptococcus loxodontisalivarius]|uniref:Polar amino acid transport system substrate-binding protein n=1 Tax=Streptococcus loxodontisalivarius TaxID=1349415 RepID=A0ABS2PRS9_9STRE|nr:transporter substrate-binding domain-containing protein [Streptococcus loxodontisalivarius]MBM7642415.1 polar amino acid transport system substrate-binding protein [Streptococcus loxodontisalivarius]